MFKKRSGFLLAILLVAVAVLSLSFFAFRQEQASLRRCNNVVRRLKKGSPWSLSSSNEFPKQKAFFKKDRVFLNYHRNLNNYQCYNSQAFKYKISFKKIILYFL
ncbi:hypothetical protein Q757_02505 [Oenococcus alcoholitolerans]|uniref:Uncharacterized protein n=1 Tax=Oenococcus alcoholitolerans TaxID=931074 RepID=A0ABR4XRR3_9LACO|nr:hypothetical protein Q757_02505 [Oenococcus alcoholitolerans]